MEESHEGCSAGDARADQEEDEPQLPQDFQDPRIRVDADGADVSEVSEEQTRDQYTACGRQAEGGPGKPLGRKGHFDHPDEDAHHDNKSESRQSV